MGGLGFIQVEHGLDARRSPSSTSHAPKVPPRRAHFLARLRLGRTSCCALSPTRSCTASARCSPGCRATLAKLATFAPFAGSCGHPANSALHGRRAGGWKCGRGRSLDWPLLDDPDHAGVRAVVTQRPTAPPGVVGIDFRPEGFAGSSATRGRNVIAFARFSSAGTARAASFSHRARGLALPLPAAGAWRGAQRRFLLLGLGCRQRLGITPEGGHGQPLRRRRCAARRHLARARRNPTPG